MMRIPAATFVAVVIIATSSSFVDGEQEEGGEGFCQQDRCDASIDDVKSGQDNHDADQAEREKEGASECVHLDIPSMLSAGDWPSIIVIEAKGRLGNHLIAFTLVGALAKQLGFRPFILDDTYGFLSPFFSNMSASVPVLQWSFCNWEQIPFESFEGDIDELIRISKTEPEGGGSIARGKFLNLWPNGYLPHSTECCPAEELQKFVVANWYQEAKTALTLKDRFRQHAEDLKSRAAARVGVPLGEITFVGIHNRRTDYVDYMRRRYGETKNPYNKRFFREAMDYFREEHEHPVFFYVSDDMEWGRKNVRDRHGDLFFVGKGDTDSNDAIGYDLAVLASCNHSVVSWGSFSMWSAFLAGGEYYSQYGVIVPKHIQEPERKRKRRGGIL